MRTVNLVFSRMGRSVIPLGMEGEHGVTTVRFDRGGRLYHGRVQALADGARNAGLKF